MRNPRTRHIRSAGIRSRENNNNVERLQGTVRERNKVMRGLKNPETPITDGFQIYYNFIRSHMSLDGKTPAEASGIDLELGENKWLSLLQKSLKQNRI